MSRSPYHGHRFPPAVIQHVVWLYLRFTLSLRDVEEMLAERGLDLTYETVRRWVGKFGPLFARELRKRRPRPTARWHLDEMVVTIAGKRHWLWRAVDDEGEVLDMLVQTRRDTRAAVRIMRKLVRKLGFAPETVTPTSLGHTGPPSGSSASKLAMSKDSAGTTGPRTPINRRVDENGKCSGSCRRGLHSAFCRPTLLSTTPSTSSAISCLAQP